MQIVLILNNIRSNENVGSIFRTADAAGVYKIYICGYTPAPVDKFGRVNTALAKAALGAEKFVEWEKVKKLKGIIKRLKKETCLNDKVGQEYKIIAVEQNKNSIDYRNLKLTAKSSKLVFVFGNEVTGLSKNDLSLCDTIVEIPMRGKKESLNVAVATGVVLFSIK